MTRNETIYKMMKMANKFISSKYGGWSEEQKIWRICSDWNSEHYDGHGDEAEIFMCEIGDDTDDRNVIGFMIEDDPFYYPESWK